MSIEAMYLKRIARAAEIHALDVWLKQHSKTLALMQSISAECVRDIAKKGEPAYMANALRVLASYDAMVDEVVSEAEGRIAVG